MGTIKSHAVTGKSGPSTFALLIDDINKMTESEQKVLWLQINKEKISTLAKTIDASVAPNNLSADEIIDLVKEARKHGKRKKG